MKAGLILFVLCELILLAVEAESAVGNSVSISADNLTLIIRKIKMTVQAVEADCDVVHPTVLVGSVKSLKCCAEVDELKCYILVVGN